MPVIWLNGTVGSGKSAVGRALAAALPASRFLDGDDVAGPGHLPKPLRWRRALEALLRAAAWRGRHRWLVIAYPLQAEGARRLRAVCGRAGRRLCIVNLDTPLAVTLRGRGQRKLSPAEQDRVRVMRSEGYHRRRFAMATISNTASPVRRTVHRILGRLPPPR